MQECKDSDICALMELIAFLSEWGCWNISLLGSLLRSLLGERQPW